MLGKVEKEQLSCPIYRLPFSWKLSKFSALLSLLWLKAFISIRHVIIVLGRMKAIMKLLFNAETILAVSVNFKFNAFEFHVKSYSFYALYVPYSSLK